MVETRVMILSVDPGTKHFGLALFDDGELQRAWLETVPPEGRPDFAFMSESRPVVSVKVVVEKMQIYPGAFAKTDLMNVGIVSGEFVGLLWARWLVSGVEYVYPRTWKGSIEKGAHHPRIMAALSESEISMIELPRAKSLHHNIVDAVGIGLWHCGRLGRGRVKKKS